MTELEKAAINYRDELNRYLWSSSQDCTVEYAKEAFIAGAQWQAKQSPWIKTSERLPIPTIEIVDGEEYGSVFAIGRFPKWKTPYLCSYYGPDYWMPIPE